MKKLSIEEKAKAYNMAINKIMDYRNGNTKMYTDVNKAIDYLFPELKESEDEKIRKFIATAIENLKIIDNEDRNSLCNKALAWLEKQFTPQVRTGLEWINIIDDACDKRYSEEYAHGEYCHEQSFKWGFQEGVDWLEKQSIVDLYDQLKAL